jgi:hypothetical protein
MRRDTNLPRRNILDKASLYHGSENWIIVKLEASQMRVLKQPLGLVRRDRQRNPNIRNIKSGQHSRKHKIVSEVLVAT